MVTTTAEIDVPDNLLEAAERRRLVLFIGAGFSKNISKKIPIGSQLLAEVAKHTKFDPRILEAYSAGDYQLLAEYLMDTGEYSEFIKELNLTIHDRRFDVSSSRAHAMLTEIEAPFIFTTNWDSWIEKAFDRNRKHLRIVRRPSDLLALEPQPTYGTKKNRTGASTPPISPVLIKYHGDFTDPSSLVFSVKSYFDRVIEESPYDLILGNLLLNHSILFIGYSFSDLNLRFIWYKMLKHRLKLTDDSRRQSMPTSYILTSSPNPVSEAWLKRIGIESICADPSPNAFEQSVVELLKQVGDAQQ